jgi:Holliday junction resolvase
MLKNITHAILYVTYKDKKYKSIKLDLEEEDNVQLIENISKNGTDSLLLLKFPTSAKKIIIISKKQLAESIIEIELLQQNTETKETKLIKS